MRETKGTNKMNELSFSSPSLPSFLGTDSGMSFFREISAARKDEFFHKGYKNRYFFPHNIYYLPKCGPDGFQLAQQMCGINEPNKLWEIVLYCCDSLIEPFPEELFFDDNIVWHQQQFGKVGQVATANLAIDGDKLYSYIHGSDIVQRISRRREYKTQIEKRFKGWHHMLLNSILNFATENGFQYLYLPTSDLAIKYTDHKRRPKFNRTMFDRIYDRDVKMHFKTEVRDGWWVIDVNENRDKLVIPEVRQEVIEIPKKTICLFHDLERGLGHIDIDPNLVEFANQNASDTLDKMLEIEQEMGVKATYNVVGSFLNEVREKIEGHGHCIAFHSYDHQIDSGRQVRQPSRLSDVAYQVSRLSRLSRITSRIINKIRRNPSKPPPKIVRQLEECRRVDYRIKGYRPPQSKITPELNDKNLCHHNFEWLASHRNTLAVKSPELQNRIVKIPVLFDDYGMYKRHKEYEIWEQKAIEMIKQNDFVAFGLHDCYAHYWLPHYRGFLEKIRALGEFKTFNEVANTVFLASTLPGQIYEKPLFGGWIWGNQNTPTVNLQKGK